jgi:hypothetical protein
MAVQQYSCTAAQAGGGGEVSILINSEPSGHRPRRPAAVRPFYEYAAPPANRYGKCLCSVLVLSVLVLSVKTVNIGPRQQIDKKLLRYFLGERAKSKPNCCVLWAFCF